MTVVRVLKRAAWKNRPTCSAEASGNKKCGEGAAAGERDARRGDNHIVSPTRRRGYIIDAILCFSPQSARIAHSRRSERAGGAFRELGVWRSRNQTCENALDVISMLASRGGSAGGEQRHARLLNHNSRINNKNMDSQCRGCSFPFHVESTLAFQNEGEASDLLKRRLIPPLYSGHDARLSRTGVSQLQGRDRVQMLQ